jgi:hypothetical protein
MFRLIACSLALCVSPFNTGCAATAIDTAGVNKSVVFFFGADPEGHVLPNNQLATGFLIMVTGKSGQNTYPLLVTARHVVDPLWAGCAPANPARLFLRVNNKSFDPQSDQIGVSYIAVELFQNGTQMWNKSQDDNVDVAVLKAPPEFLSGDYDVRFINVRNFGRPDEISKIGIGSQVASTGLVPGVAGTKRNFSAFKFGKVAGIPDEMATLQCAPHSPTRTLRVWWIAVNLVPGNSGSPIYFDPLFPPGSDISVGEPRVMIIGLQSLSVSGADLAGMTPAQYIIDVISHAVPADADISLGLPSK